MEVTGAHELAVELAAAAATVGPKAEALAAKTRTDIKNTAVERVAVGEGILRDSIRETGDGVEATADHARFVEDGTYKDAPQPFMGPALDEHEEPFVTGLEVIAGDI
jgi:HK97 gp10 family phage protein